MPTPSPSAAAGVLGPRLVRVLSLAQTIDEAGAEVLREVAAHLGSPLGLLWLLDEDSGLLRWANDWAADDELAEFRRACRRLTFAPSVGLPGTVLETVAPAWVEDVGADPDFPRADVALLAGLRAAVAAPLISVEGIVGVMEFFGRSPGVPTAQQLDELRDTGLALAAYLGRVRIEDRLRASEESSASIVQAALDCVITMDHHGRVVDFNPAAEATFGYARDDVVDRLLADLIIPEEFREAHRRALTEYLGKRQGTILNRRLELVGMRADGSTFPVELTVTRLGTREPPVFAGFIRDISERRDAEEKLGRLFEREQVERTRAEHAERTAREAADALQRSLLPPHLPAIAGLELGATYRAGTEGWLVGGDFYDVFELGPARWGIVIGDVCGKGPQAASMTAMVRYAIRAAAVRESAPSAVLQILNESLLGDTQHGEFCTAIYASVELRDSGPVVRMATAGHPLPLLLRPGADVEPVGRPGLLLGAFEATRLYDVEFELAPGELLLFYTDGVTEAHTSDGLLGESRLAGLLSDCAGMHPRLVAKHIEQAVVQPAGHRVADDIALLVLGAGSS